MAYPAHWEQLKERAASLPASPGVYLYKDAAGRIIYVGKAKSLRDRVRSYFLEEKFADAKTGIPYGIALGIGGLVTYPETPLMVWALGRLAGN